MLQPPVALVVRRERVETTLARLDVSRPRAPRGNCLICEPHASLGSQKVNVHIRRSISGYSKLELLLLLCKSAWCWR